MPKDKIVEIRTVNPKGEITNRKQIKRPIFGNRICYESVFLDVKQDESGLWYHEILDDIPEPWEPIIPLDPELERLLAWFITERKEIAESLDAEKVILDCDKGKILIIPKREERKLVMPVLTRRL